MDNFISEIEVRNIKLDGIIHCAGTAGKSLIGNINRSLIEEVFEPKVYGLIHLCERLSLHKLDFLYCCSSMAAFVGGVGQVDYAAASAFISQLCESEEYPNIKIKKAINWSLWRDIGMSQAENIPDSIRNNLLKNSISVAEGVSIWELASSGEDTPINILYSKKEVLDLIRDYSFEYYKNAINPKKSASSMCPKTKLQDIWCEILGDMSVESETDFYDVGGDSLSLMLVINSIDQSLNVKIPPCEAQKLKTFQDFYSIITK